MNGLPPTRRQTRHVARAVQQRCLVPTTGWRPVSCGSGVIPLHSAERLRATQRSGGSVILYHDPAAAFAPTC